MQPSAFEKGLIEPDTLSRLMLVDNPPVRILDATFVMPGSSRDPRADYENAHIPGAMFFDVEAVADHGTDLPHMLPSAHDFELAVEALGISSGEQVVVYDQTGVAMAAARAWWMFRAFGHDEVCVLNGGLPAWQLRGYPVIGVQPPAPPAPGAFTAELQPNLVRRREDVLRAVQDHSAAIVDARSTERFTGQATEPRPGLRCGHIPGSLNIPFSTLLDPATGRMKDRDKLKAIFADVPPGAVITSCGSGITACVLALGLYLAGREDAAVYDGSWAEWGRADGGMPVALLA